MSKHMVEKRTAYGRTVFVVMRETGAGVVDVARCDDRAVAQNISRLLEADMEGGQS